MSSGEGDDDAGAAEVDEGDQGAGGVEAEAAVADQADAAVEPFEPAVVQAESDRDEDPVTPEVAGSSPVAVRAVRNWRFAYASFR
jgi:hypothetical protein